ncbi:GH92 family glycosyl hydrolase [Lascolabacillus sp.]|uniref:GH92 family glycosyl hydrolase n=1 Tax=Lascolabacillus sp. TaxID=1924068 RepID=UPI00258D0D84|nr:GH92 family glycosyl hydrolase [Lascolabacillus sp.]MDD2606108.1 GH92 family glycosyl hydrolase [Lascolabacillus sp.]MDD4757885.1 GH92 family glycosyl hydrolase [Lascolabacillus sp.]
MRKTLLFSLLVLLTLYITITGIGCTSQNSDVMNGDEDLTKYVNPFIGTAFTGHTFPGATYPLGFMQPGPETGNFSWDYCSGYFYDDEKINGFSQNRLNGTGIVDFGDLLLQPFSGEKREDLSSTFNKSTEVATPGFYSVVLTDNDVKVEVTTAPHVAFHRYTYNADKTAGLLADFQSGLVWSKDRISTHVLENVVNFESDYIITGYTRRREWTERTYYFVIEFDKPIVSKELLEQRDPREKAPRYILNFDLGNDSVLNTKVAMSTTGIEGAKSNLAAEGKERSFDDVYKDAKKEWNRYLSKVSIEGTDEDKTNFYTALYHLYIQPNNIADVDGKYVGPNGKISQSPTGKFYSTLSQWDTFRAAFPMYTILSPEIINDLVNNMLEFSEQKGHLPIWALMGQETFTMIGNHSIPMVVDAYLKGFEGFDAERAYSEIKKSLTEGKHKNAGWEEYDKYGYYPYDLFKVESVSRTLESGFDDYCAALMAKKLGKTEDYEFFMNRSGFYKNHYDNETKSMRPKDSKGEWLTPFDPYRLAHADSNIGGHYTEGNALQYTWHVLQDIPGLIELLGGKEEAGKVLDFLFTTEQESTGTLSDVTGLIGQYAHGNEPSHHIAYIYMYLDRPEDTQRLIRQICNDFYQNKPDGLIGNDDCGQMSAWYMFSAMGFYPVNPVSGELVFGAPQLPKTTLNLDNGKTFTIEAINLSEENMYIEKIELNGSIYTEKFITYDDIMNGGELTFYMTSNQ